MSKRKSPELKENYSEAEPPQPEGVKPQTPNSKKRAKKGKVEKLGSEKKKNCVNSDASSAKKFKTQQGLRINAEKKLFGALSTVLKQGELSDLTVQLHETRSSMSSNDPNSKSIEAHRLVLAAMSEPLRQKIENEILTKDILTLTVENIPAFENLLDYVYGKPFFISKENILNVLKAAVTWRVDTLRDKCVDYLIKVVDLEIATTVLQASEESKLERLGEAAANTIAQNLSKIENKKEYFDSLPDSAFKKIFSRASLNTPSSDGEMAIVDLIFARTNDTGAEQERTDDLLKSCVKFVDLTDRQILALSLDKRFDTQCRQKIILDAISVNKFPSLIYKVAGDSGNDCLNHFEGAPYLKHRLRGRSHNRWLSSILG